jgi:hypothetical protein
MKHKPKSGIGAGSQSSESGSLDNNVRIIRIGRALKAGVAQW